MRIRIRPVLEILVGVGIAASALYFLAPGGKPAAEPVSLVPLSSAAAATIGGKTTSDSGVKVVVFNDFQCPWCARFDSALRELAREESSIELEFRHRPLAAIHPFAVDAAVSAECARRQGRFDDYAAALFTNQSAIGTRAWTSFASEAGVKDTAAFEACRMRDSSAHRIVRADLDASKALRSSGTPAFIIDGSEPSRPPNMAELRALLLGQRRSMPGTKPASASTGPLQ